MSSLYQSIVGIADYSAMANKVQKICVLHKLLPSQIHCNVFEGADMRNDRLVSQEASLKTRQLFGIQTKECSQF